MTGTARTRQPEPLDVAVAHVIGGEHHDARVAPDDDGAIVDRNPARPSQVLAAFRDATDGEVEAAVAAARAAYPAWAESTLARRAEILRGAAELLDAQATTLGAELTTEEGKTLPEGVAEVRRAAHVLRVTAAWAERPDGELFASPAASERIMSVRVPLGVVGLVTPWNFPIAIPAWKLAPALMFGNTVVWKPSEVTPLLALRLIGALEAAGLPAGVTNLVLGGGAVGRRLVADPRVDAISFTGSTSVGRQVVQVAAGRGAKVQAEMGGKNAAIVLADADLDVAAEAIVRGAMGSSGQKCTATSRVVVERSVAERLIEKVVAGSRRLVVGDPMQDGTDLGPLALPTARRRVLEVTERAVAGGATVAAGGRGIDLDGGWYVEPTVLLDVAVDSDAFHVEAFGPLCAVVLADDAAHAFELASLGPFGLSASLFTTNLGTVLTAVGALDVGMLRVNSETTGAEAHVPFGGSKASGYGGREMGSAARDFYTSTRTVYLRG